LVVDKTGEYIRAHPDFMMVISYNPGYQSVLKDLKQSTRQRFVSIEFDYPEKEKEVQIVAHEGQVSTESALKLVALAARIRSLREHGLTEGASTRLLIHAARLIGNGIAERDALRTAVCLPLTDDERLIETLYDLIEDVF
jgi:nitric oxide reductase NorQ protein